MKEGHDFEGAYYVIKEYELYSVNTVKLPYSHYDQLYRIRIWK